MPSEVFVAKVVKGGSITIPKDVRMKLEIEAGNYAQVSIQKLDLFKSSIHRFFTPRRASKTDKRCISQAPSKGG